MFIKMARQAVKYQPTFKMENLEEYVSIQYPGKVENVDKMLDTLGGTTKISETICDSNRRMQLWFRPDDRFSKPVNGNRKQSSALIMKVKLKKKSKEVVSFSVVGFIKEEFQFSTLCDFQYLALINGANVYNDIVPSSLDGNWFQKKPPLFLIPPLFSRADSVQNYYFCKDKVTESGQCSKVITSSRRKRRGLARFLSFEDGDVPTCPRKRYPHAAHTTTSEKDKEIVRRLFQERPIYSKTALSSAGGIIPKFLKFIVPDFAYHFTNGPWRAMWVRFGYDPRKESDAYKYQTIDFRFRKNDEDPAVQAKRSHRSTVIPREARKKSSATIFPENDDYIFRPGRLPPYRQYFYQVCDIQLPEVESMLSSIQLRTVCDSVDGWLPEGVCSNIRQIMSQYITEEIVRRQEEGMAEVLYSEPSGSSESEDEVTNVKL